jgi:hypothetical protein
MSEVYRNETGPQPRGSATYQVSNVVTTADSNEHGFEFKTKTFYTAPEKSAIWRDYTDSTEFGIDAGAEDFNIWIDQHQEDCEVNLLTDLDISREVAFELHRWLTEQLYG